MSHKRNTREICRDAVRDILESPTIEFHIQYDRIVDEMNRAANEGNDDLRQLRAFLTLGETTDEYRGAVGAYMRTMATHGNHPRALRAAAEFAKMAPPVEDRGPLDRMVNAFQSRVDQPNGSGALATAGKFVRRHTQPRRGQHS